MYIDGESSVRAPDSLWEKSLEPSYEGYFPPPRLPGKRSLEGCYHGQVDFVVRGITKSFVNSDKHIGDAIVGNNLTAVVRKGEIVCIGETICGAFIKEAEHENVPIIDVEDGYMLPVCLKTFHSWRFNLLTDTFLGINNSYPPTWSDRNATRTFNDGRLLFRRYLEKTAVQ